MRIFTHARIRISTFPSSTRGTYTETDLKIRIPVGKRVLTSSHCRRLFVAAIKGGANICLHCHLAALAANTDND